MITIFCDDRGAIILIGTVRLELHVREGAAWWVGDAGELIPAAVGLA